MSDNESRPTGSIERKHHETPWQRLASAEPIRIRDPLAEVLGMVPEGDPLVVTFVDVAKAAGHACPAVAGAYRSAQLALDRIYPNEYPVRSDVEVTVGGDPGEPGLGPMANVVRHITGAAGETGFAGFGGFGGRENHLTFGNVDGPGRTFRFERSDTGAAVVISFDPSATGVDPDTNGGKPMQMLSKVVSGVADDAETDAFRDQWHDRVQRILEAPPDGGPFSVEEVE
ncbi:FmdE domain protein (plasmid) [Haloferax gibbonsii]|uniref:FmdE domain protein n=1 Tax=Haloferax gibbonsii TaxID=35746 RepID=A0A871BL19_HALGI|nr:FmdE family protein [Haloferax gibbonsii]QOS13480.1 FmdE domain protein [Haloferax gibbonsii]